MIVNLHMSLWRQVRTRTFCVLGRTEELRVNALYWRFMLAIVRPSRWFDRGFVRTPAGWTH